MADANEAATESDRVGTVKAGSVSVPVLVLNACATFIVAIALSVTAVLAKMSTSFIITSAVLAVVGGCGVLAALVAHNTRKTIVESQRVIIEAMNLRMDQAEADLCDIKTSLVKQAECSTKTAKGIRTIATGLTECKIRITEEVEKVRVAQYALHAETAGAAAKRPQLGIVEN
jgi:hypothetical protein